MKPHLKTSLLLLALPAALLAQTATTPPDYESPPSAEFGPQTGSTEITLGGGGGSSKDFDDSFGGVNASYGYYFSDTLVGVVRQSINYVNPERGGTSWNGSTRLALDHHFLAHDALRPFVGINAGRIYGDAVEDTWAAGIEAGAKYYVQPKTFIFALVDYAWLFEEANDVEKQFDDGQFFWSLGVGFNL